MSVYLTTAYDNSPEENSIHVIDQDRVRFVALLANQHAGNLSISQSIELAEIIVATVTQRAQAELDAARKEGK